MKGGYDRGSSGVDVKGMKESDREVLCCGYDGEGVVFDQRRVGPDDVLLDG